MQSADTDVLIVGAGNAALCAALSAREAGASVQVLECAPESERGGNTTFTAGAMRVAYNGVEDLQVLMPDLSESEIETTDFGKYPASAFFEDMGRVTDYRADPDLVELLVTKSFDTLRWMGTKGVRFVPMFGRQAFQVNGKFRFWGGLTVETQGGGPGLIEALTDACQSSGIHILYEARAISLISDDNGVHGVRVRHKEKTREIYARSVVLASGGFEANAAMRSSYLGPGWDLAKVRGTRFNRGDGIQMALDIGASPAGHWSGCHAVAWDRNAPEFGDLSVGDGFQKHSYPWGVVVNSNGDRFIDEGADFRNYTYAKYGKKILEQPGQVAWQVFDAQVAHLLRDEYRIREVSSVKSDSLEGLARKMQGIDRDRFLRTIREYNDAIDTTAEFDPTIRDGRQTHGLLIPKSNWANTLEEPPFEAYQVTCGITFTFGGLRIDQNASVLNADGNRLAGLFACGELVGGLFYLNYPGGTGLTSGSVFGRVAGAAAAAYSQL